MKYAIILFATVLMLSCTKTLTTNLSSPEITSCTQTLIDSASAKPKGELFTQVDAYRYNGDVVYLYIAGCCDRYDNLKDKNCTYLFSPSGGIAGCGDCTHKNFFNEAVYLNTIWKDPRP